MATTRKGPAQVIEGRLDRFPVAEVVSQLSRDGATGILLLQRGDEEKKAVFSEGEIVYASSSNKEEKLGYLLVEEGKISREDLLAAAKDGRGLREYLLEEDKLEESEYDEAVAGLILDIMATAFAWNQGEFSFVEKESVDIPGQIEGISMPDLFLEGVGCIEDPEQVQKALGKEEATLLPSADAAILEQELHLQPSEDLVYAGIDGSSSIGEVVAGSMMGPDMTRRLLYALVLSGHLEVEGRKTVGLPNPTRRSRLARQRRKGGRRGVRKSVLRNKKKPGVSGKAEAAAGTASSAGKAEEKEEEKRTEEAPEEPFDQQIARKWAETRDKNHYEVLGVEQKAEDSAIRSSYHDLARRFHPDKLGPGAEDELRTKLEQLFGRIGEAYNVLRDAERRAEYDEELASGAGTESRDVSPIEAAREAYEKGRRLFSTDKQAAARFFEYATNNDPDNADYWYHLGLALSGQSMTRKKAEEAFQKALEKDPSNFKIHFQLGLLYKAGGLKTRAAAAIRKGLQWDPDNVKMQGILAELEGEDESKGGLGGLFRRK